MPKSIKTGEHLQINLKDLQQQIFFYNREYAWGIMPCMTIWNVFTLNTLYTELSAIFVFASELATYSTHNFPSKVNTVTIWFYKIKIIVTNYW